MSNVETLKTEDSGKYAKLQKFIGYGGTGRRIAEMLKMEGKIIIRTVVDEAKKNWNALFLDPDTRPPIPSADIDVVNLLEQHYGEPDVDALIDSKTIDKKPKDETAPITWDRDITDDPEILGSINRGFPEGDS